MRYAIYNSHPYHYEMFAHLIDYFKDRGLQIDIYTNMTNLCGWMTYYQHTYGINTWFSTAMFDPTKYDTVFLMTDDDPTFAFWNTRVVVYEHDSERTLNLPAYRTLQTRQFMLRDPPSDPNTWIIPVWNNPIKEKYDRLTVLSVGNAALYVQSMLPAIFSNFNDINFILVDRNMPEAVNGNITTHNSLDATALIDIASKSHYILFWPTTGYSYRHKNISMTGALPLAYSVGTPLLMPADFAEAIGLDGIIGIHPPFHLATASIPDCSPLIERRNRILDDVIRPRISTYIFNWKKVTANSLELYNKIAPHVASIKIVNSDENHTYHVPQIQLDDSYFYGGQFVNAITDVSDGDILCVVVGDNLPTNDFRAMFDAARAAFQKHNVGVYAPNDKREIAHAKRNACYTDELYDVDTTDCGFWFIHPRLVRRLRHLDFAISKFGWGVDTVIIAEARKQGMLVLRDYSVETDQLDHTCGYDVRGAMYGMQLLQQAYSTLAA